MTWLALGLCLGVVLALSALAVAVQRRSRPSSPRQHQVNLEVRARSADKALVRIAVQAELTTTPTSTSSVLRDAVHELEAEVRHCVATRRLLALPGIGDELTLKVSSPEIALASVVVTGADVEVTRELRRLVGGP